jgi:hypothetical protein
MEPEYSCPRSHEPITVHYIQPDELKPHPKTLFYYAPTRHRSLEWSLPFRFSNENITLIFHRPHACYIPNPSHSPSDTPTYIWQKVQMMEVFTVKLLSGLLPLHPSLVQIVSRANCSTSPWHSSSLNVTIQFSHPDKTLQCSWYTAHYYWWFVKGGVNKQNPYLGW